MLEIDTPPSKDNPYHNTARKMVDHCNMGESGQTLGTQRVHSRSAAAIATRHKVNVRASVCCRHPAICSVVLNAVAPGLVGRPSVLNSTVCRHVGRYCNHRLPTMRGTTKKQGRATCLPYWTPCPASRSLSTCATSSSASRPRHEAAADLLWGAPLSYPWPRRPGSSCRPTSARATTGVEPPKRP